MNRAGLEGLREALRARDWNRTQDVGPMELYAVLDALLAPEGPPVDAEDARAGWQAAVQRASRWPGARPVALWETV